MAAFKIKKGDKVMILAGKDKGKTGLVERVITKTAQVLIPGINVVKKHTKATKENPTGGVAEIAKPLPIGKVIIVCPNCGKPTRIGFSQGKTKERICKKCGKAIHLQKESPKGDK